MIAVTLPWPDRRLHPNHRSHWAEKAKAVKIARATAHKAALEVGIRRTGAGLPQALKVTPIFYPPNMHAHDIDGLLSSMKAAFDGIADAIGIDDSKWTFGSPRRDVVVKGGLVRIELERI